MPDEQDQQNNVEPPPQPGPEYALPVLQQEIADLRAENAKLRDARIYLAALNAQSESVIGSLLAQLSQAQPNPDTQEATPGD